MKLKKLLVEVVNGDSDFMKILDIVKGRKTFSEVEFDDPHIKDVDDGIITFSFDNENDFFEYFTDYEEGEISDIFYALSDYGSSYEMDYSMVEEDFSQGYVFDSMDDENKKHLYKIMKMINPSLSGSNEDFYNDQEGAYNILNSLFPDEIEKWKDEYMYARQNAIDRGLYDYTKELVDKVYEIMSVTPIRRYSNFEAEMPISKLMLMYSRVGTSSDKISDVIDNFKYKQSQHFKPAPNEVMYEVEDYEYFKSQFNAATSNILSDIENLIDDDDENIQERIDLYNQIQKKYGFNSKLRPAGVENENIYVSVESVDEDLKLKIAVYDGWRKKYFFVKPSTFETLMNNYSLFDIEV